MPHPSRPLHARKYAIWSRAWYEACDVEFQRAMKEALSFHDEAKQRNAEWLNKIAAMAS